MTNKEILYQAILKVEKNDYKYHLNFLPIVKVKKPEELAKSIFFEHCSEIIFSHDFAKAFWGERIKEFVDEKNNFYPIYDWEYHLQQMVLEKEPLKYLEKFLK